MRTTADLTARRLSVLAALLMAVAATGGLLWPEVYRESAPMTALLRGYDLVTLTVAVPALAIALLPPLRNSLRARLVWLGVLGYGLYTYATYLFGTGFNAFFLLHVAVFTLSLYALVLALWRLDVSRIRDRFHVRTPVRWIAGFLGLLAVALGGMWVFYSVRFAVTGQAPAEPAMVSPASLLHLGYVLDLALLVPWYLVTAAAVAASWLRVHLRGHRVGLRHTAAAAVSGGAADAGRSRDRGGHRFRPR